MKFNFIDCLINFVLLGIAPSIAGWGAAYFMFTSISMAFFCILICIFVCMTLHKIIYREWYNESSDDKCKVNDYVDIDDNLLE